MEPDIDGVKFAGGAVMAMQRRGVTDLIDVAHDNGAYASCAGGIEMAFEKVRLPQINCNGITGWHDPPITMGCSSLSSTASCNMLCATTAATSAAGRCLQGGDAVQRYLKECRSLGFDAVEFGCAPFRSEACCRIVDSIKQVGICMQCPMRLGLV